MTVEATKACKYHNSENISVLHRNVLSATVTMRNIEMRQRCTLDTTICIPYQVHTLFVQCVCTHIGHLAVSLKFSCLNRHFLLKCACLGIYKYLIIICIILSFLFSITVSNICLYLVIY